MVVGRVGVTDWETTGIGDHLRGDAHRRIYLFQPWLSRPPASRPHGYRQGICGKNDSALRRICGWERKNDVPDEWTFSRAFAEFSKSRLPERVHEAFIKKS